MKISNLLPAMFMLMLNAGCSGGDSFSFSEKSSPAQVGIFLDGPVSGVQYRTETIFGTTNGDGEFLYNPGETITFYIGDIELGQATPQAQVTLIELVPEAYDATNQTVINMARFLQTLDADGNPNNGIEITLAVRQAAVGKSVSFKVSEAEFEANAQLLALLQATTTQTALVDGSASTEHFNGTLQGLDGAAFFAGEHFTGRPKLKWTLDENGAWQTALAADQSTQPYYLSILRRNYGLSLVIDQKLTYVDTGYPAELAADGKSAIFEATSIFSKVKSSGSATLWNWKCAIVSEHTALKNYMAANGMIAPYTVNANGQRIPIENEALTCTISVVDDNSVAINWGIDAKAAVYYQDSQMLAISFSASYK